jgi:hypothetical protein
VVLCLASITLCRIAIRIQGIIRRYVMPKEMFVLSIFH